MFNWIEGTEAAPSSGPCFPGEPHGAIADRIGDDAIARTRRYASGLSRAADFTTAAWCGHPLGVAIDELSTTARDLLAGAVARYGTPLFVDSGAYGAAQRGDKLDFAEVLSRYDALLESIAAANEEEAALPPPLMVMPDRVADQAATVALLRTHRAYIAAALAFPGVSRPIVALHRGERSLVDAFHMISDLLGRDDFIVGLPSHAPPAPDQVTDLVQLPSVRAVHVLGALSDLRLRPLVVAMARSGRLDGVALSSDGNPLRSAIIARGQSQADRRGAISRVLGAPARRAELSRAIQRMGGLAGLRAAYGSGSPQDRARLIGLISDLSDLAPGVAQRTFLGA